MDSSACLKNIDPFASIPDQLRQARRWLVWKADSTGNKSRKIPYYAAGSLRGRHPQTNEKIDLDSPEDWACLVSFEEAYAALQSGDYTGLGFALGLNEDGGYWQGIDFDDLDEHPEIDALVDELPGYVEYSPSEQGVHAIGYGKYFRSLGSNGSGIEAYSSGRYFTVTGKTLNTSTIIDLADYVQNRLVPLHQQASTRPERSRVEPVTRALEAAAITPLLKCENNGALATTLKELRISTVEKMLSFIKADCDYDLWYKIGSAIRSILPDDEGFRLWDEWSQTAPDRYEASQMRSKWQSFEELTEVGPGTLIHWAQQGGYRGSVDALFEHTQHSAPADSPKGFVNASVTMAQALEKALDPTKWLVANDSYAIDRKTLKGHDIHGVLYQTLLEKRIVDGEGETDAKTAANLDVIRLAHQSRLYAFNEHHAAMLYGSKPAVVREINGDTGRITEYRILKPNDLYLDQQHVSAYKVVGNDIKRTNLAKDWWSWPEKRRYENGLRFIPGESHSEHYYNPWFGFAVEPSPGDWSLLQRLILESFCGGNQDHYIWFIDWMASLIQNPAERYGVALVIRSEKGIGKGRFWAWFSRLFHKQNTIELSNMEQLTGRFSGHLEGKVLVYANEAIWGGKKSHEGTLKSLITDENIPMERKGFDLIQVPNYLRLLITSNEEWAALVGLDERRFFVLDAISTFKENYAFFQDLEAQMSHGGLEAMLCDLMERTITTNQREAPRTEALASLAEKMLSADQEWLLDALRRGFFWPLECIKDFSYKAKGIKCGLLKVKSDGSPDFPMDELRGQIVEDTQPRNLYEWPALAEASTLYQSYLDYSVSHGYRPSDLIKNRDKLMQNLRSNISIDDGGRPTINGKRVRLLKLPELADARAQFEAKTKMPFNFDPETGADGED